MLFRVDFIFCVWCVQTSITIAIIYYFGRIELLYVGKIDYLSEKFIISPGYDMRSKNDFRNDFELPVQTNIICGVKIRDQEKHIFTFKF